MADQDQSTTSDTGATANQTAPRGMIAYFKALLTGRSNGNVKDAVREALSDEDRATTADFSQEERELLGNILDYSEVRVEDVMVPRSDIICVDVNTGLSELIRLYSDATHSRMPIYRDTLDNVLGLVHVKDVMSFLAQDKPAEDFRLASLRRPLLYVPPTMRVMDLLADMRRQRTHMAVVVDEYGGTDGLVTIEDLVEQIVGDIEDEHDVDEEPELTELSPGQYLVDARMDLVDLSQELQLEINAGDRDSEVDTLGGLLFTLVGEVPEIGTIIDHEQGLRFEVVDADPRRIKKVRITRGAAATGAADALKAADLTTAAPAQVGQEPSPDTRQAENKPGGPADATAATGGSDSDQSEAPDSKGA